MRCFTSSFETGYVSFNFALFFAASLYRLGADSMVDFDRIWQLSFNNLQLLLKMNNLDGAVRSVHGFAHPMRVLNMRTICG